MGRTPQKTGGRALGQQDMTPVPSRDRRRRNGNDIVKETCPECGAPWDREHNRCTANCQSMEVFDEQIESERS
jgi:hypothetical protein